MFCKTAAATHHGAAPAGSRPALPRPSIFSHPHLHLLLGLGSATVAPLLVAIAVLAFGLDVAGVNPAPYAIGLGLVGMGWLIDTSQRLDGTVAGGIRAEAEAETRALTACTIEMRRSNAALEAALAATRTQLDLLTAERDDLAVQLTLDPLTGAQNRRGLDAAFSAHGMGTVLALLDIDHFKTINDSLGHDVGDRVLRDFARLLRTRLGDLPLYRVGGEEFVILFPETEMAGVAALLDGVRADLKTGIFTRTGDPVTVSFSAGLALKEDAAQSFGAVFKTADERLYAAKTAGRARTVHGAAPQIAAAA